MDWSKEELLYQLENDFDKAILELRNNIDNYRFKKEDKQKILEILKDNKYVFSYSDINIAKSEFTFLLASLINDYDLTIKRISYLPITEKFEYNNKEIEVLYKLLIKSKFTLDEYNANICFNSPVFLLASLKNNYDKTIKCLTEFMNFSIPFNDYESKKLTEILLENGFVYDEKTPKAFYDDPGAFLVSIENDYELTMANYKYNKLMSSKDKEGIYQVLIGQEPSCTYWNYDLLFDPDILSKLVDEESKNFIIEYLANDDLLTYDEELEFLKLLPNKVNSLEEELVYLHDNNKNRYNMSLLEMGALMVYAKRELAKHGVDKCLVNLFCYSEDKNLGLTKGKTIYVFCLNDDEVESVKEMVLTLNHEVSHMIQQKNIIENNFDSDPDIDVYSKDYLMGDMDDSYYSDNAHVISFEFDAEAKSYLKSSDLFGYSREKYFIDVSNGDFYNGYRYTNTREYHGKEYFLDELFEKKVNEELSKAPILERKELLRAICAKYPLFFKEYHLEHNRIVKRGIKELLENFNNTSKDEYKYLIEQSLLEYKNQKFKENKLIVLDYLNDNLAIKEELLEIVNRADMLNENPFFKYLGKSSHLTSNTRNKKI